MNSSVPRCDRLWCSAPAGHAGNHIARIGEVQVPTYNTASFIGVSVAYGPTESDPLPGLTLVSRLGVALMTVRLDWPANNRLAGLLAGAASRFA